MILCYLGLLLVAWHPWACSWFSSHCTFPSFFPLQNPNPDINLSSWIWPFPPLPASLSPLFSSPVQNISVSGLKMFATALQKNSLKYSDRSKTTKRCICLASFPKWWDSSQSSSFHPTIPATIKADAVQNMLLPFRKCFTLMSEVSRWLLRHALEIEEKVLSAWSNFPPCRFRKSVVKGS